MSPEQAAGSRDVDGRSDLYSLGCVLYEMLAGHPPFQGSTPHEVLARHLTDPVPPLRTGRTTIPAAVAGAVERVLSKAPVDRFRTAAEFTAALEQADTQAPAGAPGWGRRRRFTVATALVLATAFVAAAWWYAVGSGHRSTLEARRVVVVPLVDLTGDARLAQLGDLAADWITRRLSQASLSLEVMPATLVREAWLDTSTARADHVRALAQRLAAGVVVSGTYAREGASLRFEAEIIDARAGRLIASIEPVVGPVERLNAVVGTLAERVSAAAAARLEPGVTRSSSEEENPPSLEAFREYQQGLEVFSRGDWEQSIVYFRRAMAIDSGYLSPIPWAATAYNNLGRWATSDTLLSSVRSRTGRLAPIERVNVEWLSAIVHGDREGQLRWAEEGFRLAPGSWAYPLGLSEVATNHPRRALDVLARYDRETPFAQNWIAYWQQLGNAHHLLGEYDAELEVARKWRAGYPQQLAGLALEVRALVALGRLSEVDTLVAQSTLLPPQGQGRVRISAALVALVAGQELRAHGFADAAQATLDRAIRQIERGDLGEADAHLLGRALYVGGRWAEARALFDSLHRGEPLNVDDLGFLGASSARLGDRQRAATADSLLALVRQPYIRGRHTLWRAQIAALLGDRSGAVRLLRQADAEGAVVALDLHRERDFESLRDYPPFQEFVRPKE
jgi:tetratricopeptide (TPR) repeat protein